MHPISEALVVRCRSDGWYGGEEWNDPGFCDMSEEQERMSKGFERPPATLEQICAAEEQLGFALPDMLKTVLCEVANGCFGPGYGLLGVPAPGVKKSLVSEYEGLRERVQWPRLWIPVCDFGCGIISATHARTARVLRHMEGPIFCLEDASLEDWLQAWASGASLFGRLPSSLASPFDDLPPEESAPFVAS